MARCIGAEKYFPSAADREKNVHGSKRTGRESARVKSTGAREEVKAKGKTGNRPNTLSISPPLEYHRKLFEEFFVIGPDTDQFKGFDNKIVSLVKPKKLFQYPNLVSEKHW